MKRKESERESSDLETNEVQDLKGRDLQEQLHAVQTAWVEEREAFVCPPPHQYMLVSKRR